jgi:hypothetical protein
LGRCYAGGAIWHDAEAPDLLLGAGTLIERPDNHLYSVAVGRGLEVANADDEA